MAQRTDQLNSSSLLASKFASADRASTLSSFNSKFLSTTSSDSWLTQSRNPMPLSY